MNKIRVLASEIIEHPLMYKICKYCLATNLNVNQKCHNCGEKGLYIFEDDPEEVKKHIEEGHKLHDYGNDGDFEIAVADIKK